MRNRTRKPDYDRSRYPRHVPTLREQAENATWDLEDLDTVAKNLAHGKKRFLDIAMVLGMDSRVILFDEPAVL